MTIIELVLCNMVEKEGLEWKLIFGKEQTLVLHYLLITKIHNIRQIGGRERKTGESLVIAGNKVS